MYQRGGCKLGKSCAFVHGRQVPASSLDVPEGLRPPPLTRQTADNVAVLLAGPGQEEAEAHEEEEEEEVEEERTPLQPPPAPRLAPSDPDSREMEDMPPGPPPLLRLSRAPGTLLYRRVAAAGDGGEGEPDDAEIEDAAVVERSLRVHDHPPPVTAPAAAAPPTTLAASSPPPLAFASRPPPVERTPSAAARVWASPREPEPAARPPAATAGQKRKASAPAFERVFSLPRGLKEEDGSDAFEQDQGELEAPPSTHYAAGGGKRARLALEQHMAGIEICEEGDDDNDNGNEAGAGLFGAAVAAAPLVFRRAQCFRTATESADGEPPPRQRRRGHRLVAVGPGQACLVGGQAIPVAVTGRRSGGDGRGEVLVPDEEMCTGLRLLDAARGPRPVWERLPALPFAGRSLDGHSVCAVRRAGALLLFGGRLNGELSNALHSFDFVRGRWNGEASGVGAASGSPPEPRAHHTATAVRGQMVVFGGVSHDRCLGDCHVFDPALGAWSVVAPAASAEPSPPPAPRAYHSAHASGPGGGVVVFGGSSPGHGPFNDVHELNVGEGRWSCLSRHSARAGAEGRAPRPRSGHASAVSCGHLVVLGGEDDRGGIVSDVWLFSLAGGFWQPVELGGPAAPLPPLLEWAACPLIVEGVPGGGVAVTLALFGPPAEVRGWDASDDDDGDARVLSVTLTFSPPVAPQGALPL